MPKRLLAAVLALLSLLLLVALALFLRGFATGGDASLSGRDGASLPDREATSQPARASVAAGAEPSADVTAMDPVAKTPLERVERLMDDSPFLIRAIDPEGRAISGIRVATAPEYEMGWTELLGRQGAGVTDEAGRYRINSSHPRLDAVLWSAQGDYDVELVDPALQLSDRLRERVVIMKPRLAYPVQVLHQDGRAAEGIEVAIMVKSEVGPDVFAESAAGQARTDRDGRALIPCLFNDLDAEANLVAFIPHAPEPELRINPRVIPSEPTILRLPASGGLRLKVATSLRERLREGDEFVLRALPFATQSLVPDASARLGADDSLSFGNLELGRRWSIQVASPRQYSGLDSWESLILGPREAGEIVEAELDFESISTIFSIQLLNESGRPVSARKFELRQLSEPFASDFHDDALCEPRSDGDGRVDFFFGPEFSAAQGDSRTRLRISLAAHSPIAFANAPCADIELPELPWLEKVDLGAVKLRRHPLIISGRVLDEEGKPVPTALVALEFEAGEVADYGRLGTESKLLCNHDGTFEIRRDPNQAALDDCNLWVEAAGFRRLVVPKIKAGTTDCELRLARAFDLELEFLLDEGRSMDWFSVVAEGSVLRPTAGESLQIQTACVLRPLGGARFRLPDIGLGNLDIRLLAGDAGHLGAPVLTREIEVDEPPARPGEPLRRSIDLRGQIPLASIRLCDQEGRGLRGSVKLDCGVVLATAKDGTLRLPRAFTEGEVEFARVGYWRKFVAGPFDELVVDLEPAKSIEVVALDEKGEPFPADSRLMISPGSSLCSFDAEWLEDGRALIRFDSTKETTWFLTITDGQGGSERRLAPVRVDPSMIRIEVRFPARR